MARIVHNPPATRSTVQSLVQQVQKAHAGLILDHELGPWPNCYRDNQVASYNRPPSRSANLARVKWASNVSAIYVTANACDLEDGVDDAADAFAGDEPGRHGVAIDVERPRAFLGPGPCNNGAE